MNVVLGSAYWPNIQYLYYLINAQEIYIDHYEHYQKQSYRNRTTILSANGELDLSIPIKKSANNSSFNSIEISYAEDWQKQHWRAIQSAYKNSPYFDFLEDEIEAFYNQKFQYLHHFNAEQLKWILKVFKQKKEIIYTESYFENQKTDSIIDLRNSIHPKEEITDESIRALLEKPYYQTFSTKFGFVPNLSVLDLIFNEGIKGHQYLFL